MRKQVLGNMTFEVIRERCKAVVVIFDDTNLEYNDVAVQELLSRLAEDIELITR